MPLSGKTLKNHHAECVIFVFPLGEWGYSCFFFTRCP